MPLHSVFAQTKKWTLDDCIAYAKENNVNVLQRLLSNEKLEKERVKTIGNFFPDLTFGASQSYISTYQNPSTEVTQSASGNTNFSLSSSVILFDGLANVHRNLLAKLDQQKGVFELEKVKLDLELMVANQYLQVLFYKETLKTAKFKLENSLKQFEKKKEQFEVHSITKSDVLEHQILVEGDRKELENSKNQIQNSLIKLKELLTVENLESFDVVAIDPKSYESDAVANQLLSQDYSLTTNPILKVKEYDLQMSEKQIRIQKASFYPTVSLNYSFGTNYYKLFGNGILTPPFFTQLNLNKQHSLSLGVSVPIFTRLKNKSNIQIANLNYQASQIDYNYAKQELGNKIDIAKNDVSASLNNYKSSVKILDFQREVFDISTDKYDLGLISVYDYVESRTRMDRALSDFIRSKSELILKQKILDYYLQN